jgi:hypothetical protein
MSVNKFPLEIFPKELQDIISELKRTNNFAEEFTSLSMLCAVGLAIGNTMHVRAKKNWNVNTALWILFVARSGLGKSPPMKFIFQPIYDRDRELNKEFKTQFKEYEDLNKISTNEVEPKRLKHLFKDITPEQLIVSMDNNKRGIGVHSSEYKEFFNNLERYSKNGALSMLLSWYDQEEHSRETLKTSISIRLPFLSIIGGLTTKDFNIFRHGSLSGIGFFERMLVCMPTNLKAEDGEEDINDNLIEYWSNFIRRILDIEQNLDEYGEPKPRLMQYTEGAKLRLTEWNKFVNGKINNECEEYATIYSKSKATIHKFAGIFNVLTCFCESEQIESLGYIANHSLERAIKLLKYFENTHKEIIGISIESTIKRILKDEDKIEWYRSLEEQFTTERAMAIFDEVKFKERKDTDRTVYRMLQKKELFIKLFETHYKKIY